MLPGLEYARFITLCFVRPDAFKNSIPIVQGLTIQVDLRVNCFIEFSIDKDDGLIVIVRH
jgi:hypothetical protein